MAYYTTDGIRHENEEEALTHTKDFLLTELPPTEDKLIQAVHNHNWGKFDIQCTPNEDNLYVELSESTVAVHEEEGTVSRGYNLLQYSHGLTGDANETPEEVVKFIEEDKRFVSMVGHEVKSLLEELSEDDNYYYDEKSHDVVVTYKSYINNDLFHNELIYSIDDTFDGGVICQTELDNLEELLMHVRSQFVLEVEGEYNNVDGKIDGYDMFTIVDNASRDGKRVKVTVSDTQSEEA